MTGQRTPPRGHPVKGELAVRGIRLEHAARSTGYNGQYFRRVVGGAASASPEFRRRVAAWLELPESLLFVEDEQLFGASS